LSQLGDTPVERPVSRSDVVFHGMVWDVARDVVELPSETVTREYVRHPGAVAVVALNDDDEVLLLYQYRHAVRSELWEVPAGLRDMPGEDPLTTAKRELAEEADLRAGAWWLLAEYLSSPGGSDEALRVYLARDLEPVPLAERFKREAEELNMQYRWVPLDEAVTAVLVGQVRSPSAVVGILAASVSRSRGWVDLRPV
jgi:ADP-ribose pyrophosphatase